jgi:hypothetical protein
VLPALLTIVLAIAGVSWQYSNIAKWIQMLPMGRDVSNASAKDQNGQPRLDSAIGERMRPRARIGKRSVREADAMLDIFAWNVLIVLVACTVAPPPETQVLHGPRPRGVGTGPG